MKNKCENFAELAAVMYENSHKEAVRDESKTIELKKYCEKIDSLIISDFMSGVYVWVEDNGNFKFEIMGPYDYNKENTARDIINESISFECYENEFEDLSTVVEFPGIWSNV